MNDYFFYGKVKIYLMDKEFDVIVSGRDAYEAMRIMVDRLKTMDGYKSHQVISMSKV